MTLVENGGIKKGRKYSGAEAGATGATPEIWLGDKLLEFTLDAEIHTVDGVDGAAGHGSPEGAT